MASNGNASNLQPFWFQVACIQHGESPKGPQSRRDRTGSSRFLPFLLDK